MQFLRHQHPTIFVSICFYCIFFDDGSLPGDAINDSPSTGAAFALGLLCSASACAQGASESANRYPTKPIRMPNVPTLDEAGLKGFRFVSWYGLWFPAGTSAAFVQRMRDDVAAAMKDPSVRRRLDEQGLDGIGSTPRELARTVNEEMEMNKELTARIGIVPQ
jgi:tripartite-type tricarboxylate transporter receptor subunit TctC